MREYQIPCITEFFTSAPRRTVSTFKNAVTTRNVRAVSFWRCFGQSNYFHSIEKNSFFCDLYPTWLRMSCDSKITVGPFRFPWRLRDFPYGVVRFQISFSILSWLQLHLRSKMARPLRKVLQFSKKSSSFLVSIGPNVCSLRAIVLYRIIAPEGIILKQNRKTTTCKHRFVVIGVHFLLRSRRAAQSALKMDCIRFSQSATCSLDGNISLIQKQRSWSADLNRWTDLPVCYHKHCKENHCVCQLSRTQ